MKLLIYLLGIVGSIGSLIYSFNFSINPHLIFVACFLVGLFIFLGYQETKNKRQFVIGSLISEGVLLLVPSTMMCLSYIISVIIYKYREVSVYDLTYQSTMNFYDNPLICTFAFLLFFIPLFLLTTIALEKNKYFVAIFSLLPGVFIELLFTITPPWYFIASYVLYFLILLISGLQKSKEFKKPIILICILSMGLTYFIFDVETYRPAKISLFDRARTPIATAGNLRDEYDVTKQGNRFYRDSLDFVIDGATELSQFKLRGIAYELYDQGKWDTGEEVKDYIEWVYRNLEVITKITKAKTQTITIEQLSGYSYRNYVPYYLNENDMAYYGNYYVGENPQSVEMVVPNEDFNALLNCYYRDEKWQKLQEIAKKNDTQEYLKELQIYYYDNEEELLEVSDDDARIIDEFMAENSIVYDNDVYDLIRQCKDALATNTKYTLTPGDLPDNENYLNYFLNVNKKGYCVHYASSLALMLRCSGVPARFVLGYQVNGNKNKDNQLIVRDKNEHAWVEIYDDYLGWIPIEAIGSNVVNQDNPNSVPSTSDNTTNNEQVSPIVPVDNQQTSRIDSETKIQIPVYMCFIILFVVSLGVFIGQAKIRKARMFKGATTNKKMVCYYYHYLIKINGDISKIKEIADKARFSLHSINDDELKVVADYYHQETKRVYKQAKIWQKLYYKYILAVL